jgi:DNA modification methylase/transcriptional regulator with XRE-family HTH domain
MSCQILHGDCRQILPTIPTASVDSIVTDPPYELGFMGKRWDATGIAYDVEMWAECLRVLKPGGHLLAFGGTRTYHRMACAIEDAGFEIRDSIHWLYGSGFPKSLDVSKAIDRAGGASPADQAALLRRRREAEGLTREAVAEAVGSTPSSIRDWEEGRARARGAAVEFIVPSDAYRAKLADLLGYSSDERRKVGVAVSRVSDGSTYGLGHSGALRSGGNTDAAKQWDGWGTALKPAHEPIVVARKPLDGTVAANVLQHGTGALNIDACRIHEADKAGRWPANVVLTHNSSCKQIGHTQVRTGTTYLDNRTTNYNATSYMITDGRTGIHGYADNNGMETVPLYECTPDCPIGQLSQNTANAQRFFLNTEWDHIANTNDHWPRYFYIAKPSKAERNNGLDGLPERNKYKAGGVGGTGGLRSVEAAVNATPVANHHPTVKPLTLIRYLIKLVTPPDGTVLDPFAGSGTTLTAAILEHRHTIGIELTDEYHPIIHARTQWATTQTNGQLPL